MVRFRRLGIPLLIWISLKCHGPSVLLTVTYSSQSRSLEVHDQGASMCGKNWVPVWKAAILNPHMEEGSMRRIMSSLTAVPGHSALRSCAVPGHSTLHLGVQPYTHGCAWMFCPTLVTVPRHSALHSRLCLGILPYTHDCA